MFKLQFKEGKYYGEVDENKKPNGIGMIKFSNGSHYFGEWHNGNLEGLGRIIFPSGNIYKGYFVKNKKDGFGCYYYTKQGENYEGFWGKDRKQGIGKFNFQNNNYFEGFYQNDLKEGYGIFNNDRIIEEGMWENGKRNSSFNIYFEKQKTKLKSIYQNDKFIVSLKCDSLEKSFFLDPNLIKFKKFLNYKIHSNKTIWMEKYKFIKSKFKRKIISKSKNNKRSSFFMQKLANIERNLKPITLSPILETLE